MRVLSRSSPLQCLLLLVAEDAEQVVAVARRIAGSKRQARLAAVAAAVLSGVERHADIDAGIVLAQDEVDHPCNCIGAVDGRGAVFQYFDPIDGRERNGVEIDRFAVERVVGKPPAVQQHQRRAAAQRAQIRGGEAGLGLTADRLRGFDTVDVGRYSVEQLLDRGHAAALDFITRDDLDRQCAFDVGLTNVRAGDDDTFQCGRRSWLRRRRLLGSRAEWHEAEPCHNHKRLLRTVVTPISALQQTSPGRSRCMVPRVPLSMMPKPSSRRKLTRGLLERCPFFPS